MIKVVLFGHSGSGKSTTAALLRGSFEERGQSVAVLKLAKPLYDLQKEFYRLVGKELDPDEQDQILLESIASHLRRISPTSLVDDFSRRLALTTADVVINDDLRDPYVDYPALKQLGFRFVRVQSIEGLRRARLAQRSDLTVVFHSQSSAQIDLIQPDFKLDNNGDMDELRRKIADLADQLIA